ncbi:MAG: site-2 protease family protein [bacterium]|nr:site-2 protease family protein [bacterium]
MFTFLTPTFIISVLVALSVHEWAHGFVANKLGDPTAKMDGRLTLNPLAHLDPIGTALFVLIGFGWGKPVPVDPRYFKNVKRDTALVALAGPVSNLILAFISFGLLIAIGQTHVLTAATGAIMAPTTISPLVQMLRELFIDSLHINLVLMAFNLLPVAPLDGSKIIRPFIPLNKQDMFDQFEANGHKILLILIMMGYVLNIHILSLWIGIIVAPFLQIFGVISGMI